MPQVSVTLNGRAYQIACDPGQEDRLRELAGLVDARIAELVQSVGQIGDLRLTVMASLLLADELLEYKEKAAARPDTGPSDPPPPDAAQLEKLAARIEAVAERLRKP